MIHNLDLSHPSQAAARTGFVCRGRIDLRRAALQIEILALRHQLGVLSALGQATATGENGSVLLGLAVAGVGGLAIGHCRCEGWNGTGMAASIVSAFLDVEGPPR